VNAAAGATFRSGALAGALAAAVHVIPSVAICGQWSPIRLSHAGRCTWRGPAVGRIAITFDDGPSPRTTARVLDQLDALGLPATFFCLGELVEQAPGVVTAARDRGHQIEVHGYHHESHLRHRPRWIGHDLDRAREALAIAGVTSPSWLRPPYGHLTGATLWHARRAGLRVALWSTWGKEWSAPDADAVWRTIGRGLSPGAIVLLHDSDHTSPSGSAARAAAVLPRLAETIDRQGWEAVTLDTLTAGTR
jgi:peptidoglycan-N-acetylglucosamine deacetylase